MHGTREKQTKTISREVTTDSQGARIVSKGMAQRLGSEKSYNIVSKYELGKSLPTLGEIVIYSSLVNVHSEVIVDDDLDLDL